MKPEITLDVSEYTDMPIGRDSKDGTKNGSDYRDNYVKPALEEYSLVKIDFNNTLGAAPSFLEELFGGLVRAGLINRKSFHERIEVIYKYESVKNNVEKYVREADDYLNKNGND